MTSRRFWYPLLLGLLTSGVFTSGAIAQEMPPASVRYTAAEEHSVRKSVELPGTVEAPDLSPVATEVEGLVIEILAREGRKVKRGDPLAKLRTKNLELRLAAAKGQLKEAQARKERAERVLGRARELFDKDLISPNEFDDAMADYNAWDGRVIQLSADIERIELDLERCTIRSPINGVVVAEHVEVGGWIGMGDPVMDVISTEQLEVRVYLPDRYFHMLVENELAVVRVNDQVIHARVSAIIPLADTQSRVFPVKVSLPKGESGIAAGMLVQVSLPIGLAQLAVIVPKDAVVAQGPMQFVYVIDENNTAVQVPVQPGMGVGDWLVVGGEIEVGQKVVTRGNERLFPGQPVQGEPLAYELP